MTDREAILTLFQEAEAAFAGSDYVQAKKLYAQIQKESVYQGFDELSEYAKKKAEEITARMQIMQLISLGDMYQSTEDYEEALFQYNRALNELTKMMDLELQGDVQAKIFAIRQKQKENSQAEEAAQKEAEQKKEEEEAAQKEAKADRAVIRINTYIANANNALEEGRPERARELYKQALSRYNKFTGSSEDADKLYADITALGQAITEAEVKAAEEAQEEHLARAAKYMIQAKEAARAGDKTTARTLYENALAVYQSLNIWDERVQEVYDALDELEHGGAADTGQAQNDAQGQKDAQQGQAAPRKAKNR